MTHVGPERQVTSGQTWSIALQSTEGPSSFDENASSTWSVRRRIAVVGLVACTVIALAVMAFFANGVMVPYRLMRAQTETRQVANFVESYLAFQEALPGSLEDLVHPPGGMAPLMREIPLDPWRRPYVFVRCDQKSSFAIYSMGPDRRAGTDDDVYSRNVDPLERCR